MRPNFAINAESGCWLWRGCLDSDGYARCSAGPAHRAMFRAWFGPIAPGAEIHHTCEVRACVNPYHLQALSRKEHMKLLPGGPLASRLHYETQKTHCPKGHPYLPENTYYKRTKLGKIQRYCRECGRKQCKDYYLHKKGAA